MRQKTIRIAERTPQKISKGASPTILGTNESVQMSVERTLIGDVKNRASPEADQDIWEKIESGLKNGMETERINEHLLTLLPDLPERFPANLTAEGFVLGILDMVASMGGRATKEQTLLLFSFAQSDWGRMAREAIEKSEWKLPALANLEPKHIPLLRNNLAWLQVSDGCSIGCSFCGMNAERTSGKHMDVMDVLRLAKAQAKLIGPPLYLASDPLDWQGSVGGRPLHYFDLHALVMGIHGFIPYVSTALPRGKEEIYADYQGWVHRTSIIPSNQKRLEKLHHLPPLTARKYPISYSCLGWQGEGEYASIAVSKAASRPGIGQKMDWPKEVIGDDRRGTIACMNGAYVTPKGDGVIQNHLIFLRGQGDVPQGFINQPVDTANFSTPLPGVALTGKTTDNPENMPLLRWILSMGILTLEEKFEDYRQFNWNTNLVTITNDTGTRRYLYFKKFNGEAKIGWGLGEIAEMDGDGNAEDYSNETIVISDLDAKGKEYLYPLSEEQFVVRRKNKVSGRRPVGK